MMHYTYDGKKNEYREYAKKKKVLEQDFFFIICFCYFAIYNMTVQHYAYIHNM